MRGIVVPERSEDFTTDPVELFFDLGYVLAFSQLVGHLVHHPDWAGVGEVALLFWLLWLPWQQFTWAANAVSGSQLSKERLLRLAYELDGHADNVTAVLFGGLNMVGVGPEGLLSRQVPLPDIRVALALPALNLTTTTMRRALPRKVPLADAVYNLGRTALTIEALRHEDYDLLAWSMQDRLHQPYRKRFIPGYDAAMAAAKAAGAAAVVLSGAGPGLVAFARADHEKIADAMADAFRAAGVRASTLVLRVDRKGVQVRPEMIV